MPSLEKEIRRRRKVIDIMLTAHSRLRDRYHRRALILDLAIFAGSAILCATVFIDPQLISETALTEAKVRLLLGALSVAIFLLSIAALMFDWKEAAGSHGRAALVLSDLKAKGRLLAGGTAGENALEGFVKLYDSLMPTLPPIRDDEFVSLKAYHRRKIELSKAVDEHPNAPLFVLRIKLRFDGALAVLKAPTVPRARVH